MVDDRRGAGATAVFVERSVAARGRTWRPTTMSAAPHAISMVVSEMGCAMSHDMLVTAEDTAATNPIAIRDFIDTGD